MILIPHQIFYFILSILFLLSKPKIESKKWTKDDIARYKKIDHLKEMISKSLFYYILHVSDDIMYIDKDKMTDRRARVLARKRFVHDLAIMVVRGYLSVGIYKYGRHGSISDWIAVFKVARGASYDSQSVIGAIDTAAHQAPMFLTRQENSDYVASVRSKNGVNKKLVAGILRVMVAYVI